jgi:pentatricopeptide repeat protein
MYGKFGDLKTAFKIYDHMKKQKQTPDNITYICFFTACAEAGNLALGKHVHEDFSNSQIVPSLATFNSLINMYGKCGDLNTAFQIYKKILHMGLKPDDTTYICLLTTCAENNDLIRGKQIHEDIKRQNATISYTLQSVLIYMYDQCEDYFTSETLFSQLLAQNLQEDEQTFLCLLNTCATMVSIHAGKEIHCRLLNTGIQITESLQCALLVMYARCGFVSLSCSIFNHLKQTEIVPGVNTWNSMIAAAGHHGNGR